MFITQIVQGEVSELYLCEECAKKRGLMDPASLSFNEKFFPENFKQQIENLLKKVEQDVNNIRYQQELQEEDTPAISCPICDFSLAGYRKTGRLGCPDCYTVFASYLGMQLMEDGEVSPEALEASPQVRIKLLEQQMSQAVEREDYEHAAQLRDQIKQLREEE